METINKGVGRFGGEIIEIRFSKEERDDMDRKLAKDAGLTLRQYRASLKAELKHWCSCDEPDLDNIHFCDDGERFNEHCCQKHHYHCGRCGKVTQVGMNMKITDSQKLGVLRLLRVAVQAKIDAWAAQREIEKILGSEFDGMDEALDPFAVSHNKGEEVSLSDVVTYLDSLEKGATISIPEKAPELVESVEQLAERLSDAYSTDNYRGGWKGCIRMLRKMGYDDREIEAIIRSKWTRWAADSAKDHHRATSKDLLRLLQTFQNAKKEVEDLTFEHFGGIF